VKVPEVEKSGICQLCRIEAQLRHSHIISEFLYASMYDDKHRFHVLQAGEQYSSFEQKGYRERLLCQMCETKLSTWENYARGLLTGGTSLRYRREGAITWVEGIDYRRFKLFQLSILWRAGVATGEFFSKVALGPHAEQLREMLLAEDPGEPWEYGCLTIGIHRRGNMVPVIVQPMPLKILDAKGVRFTFGGYFWAYRIASHKPVQQGFTEAVLQRSGRLAVKFEALETSGFFRDFLRQSEIKRAAQPLDIRARSKAGMGQKKGSKNVERR
jgi:hypothetical protein